MATDIDDIWSGLMFVNFRKTCLYFKKEKRLSITYSSQHDNFIFEKNFSKFCNDFVFFFFICFVLRIPRNSVQIYENSHTQKKTTYKPLALFLPRIG